MRTDSRIPSNAVTRLLLPAVLLATFTVLAITSMTIKSVTTDEVQYLPAGYTYVQTGDLRLRAGHPPLTMALAAMPLAAFGIAPPWQSESWRDRSIWDFGVNFLRANRERRRSMFFRARLPIVALGILTGLILFAWARDLWGDWPAVFVLFLFSFSPNMLAHSRLVTTDTGAACFTVATLYALWKFCRSGSLEYAGYCGLGLGLGLLTKYSLSIVAIDVGVLLLAYAWYTRQDVAADGELRSVPLSTVVVAAFVVACVAALIVEVGFGFPKGLVDYYDAFLHRLTFDRHYTAFLWGEYADSFWSYYLLAQIWKTPIPTLLFFGLAMLLMDLRSACDRLRWLFLLLPIVTFHVAASLWGVDVGMRHVLPVFPFVFLCCGAVAARVATAKPAYRLLFASLCVWYAAGTLRAYPHFLPYFNELAGGPRGGIEYLGDSNIEWGQDLYLLKDAIETHRPEQVRVAVAGKLQPQDYGISSQPIGLRDVVWPREDASYFIGAQHLQHAPYLPGFRFRWLERYEPVQRIGWSIYEYRFSTDDGDRHDPQVFFLEKDRWYADAIDDLEKIVRLNPAFDEAKRLLASAYHERGDWQRSRGELEAALSDFSKAVRLPDSPSEYRDALRSMTTELRREVGKTGNAVDCELGPLLLQAGDEPEGLKTLYRCLQYDPDQLSAHAALAELYDDWGLGDLAIAEWGQCLRIDPEHEQARRRLESLGIDRRGS